MNSIDDLDTVAPVMMQDLFLSRMNSQFSDVLEAGKTIELRDLSYKGQIVMAGWLCQSYE